MVFVHALRLCRLARGTGSRTPLPETIVALASRPGLPAGADPHAAHRATVRASTRAARWFGARDTCLTRAVVVAALLADRDEVLLHVGLAPAGEGGGPLEGHAWVTVAGEVVGGSEASMPGGGPTTELTLPVRRR